MSTNKTKMNALAKQNKRRQPRNGSGQQNGRGATVKAPVATGVRLTKPGAKITTVAGVTLVKHSEAVSVSFAASGAVKAVEMPLGFTTTLPWLATMCGNFDRMRWKSVSAEWVPLLPTSIGGDVVIYFDCNAEDDATTDFGEAYGMDGSKSGPLWAKVQHRAKNTDLHQQPWYNTSGTKTGESLLPFAGKYCLLASRAETTTTAALAGRMVMTYEVEFSKPEQNAVASATIAAKLATPAKKDTMMDILFDSMPTAAQIEWLQTALTRLSRDDQDKVANTLPVTTELMQELVALQVPTLECGGLSDEELMEF